jgi:LacI family transcriptional regulator
VAAHPSDNTLTPDPDGESGPIESENAGRRRLTINDVARLARVSKKTVSRVINQSPFVKSVTRDRVAAVIAEHGYVPDPQARGLAFRRSFLIAFIYDNPSPQYVVNAQQGILDALKGSGLELVVRPVNRQAPHFIEEMREFITRQKLAGAVMFPSVSEDEGLAALMRDLDTPYVRIASISLDEPEAMIVSHDSQGAAGAARHLAQAGHSLIAHISGPSTFRSSHVRREGFEAGLLECGLRLDPAYAAEGAYTFESGLACAEQLLDLQPRPTAIFAGNDEMALGVYQAARNRGLEIPRDLSVIGFDDSPIASRVWPLLTTVVLPIREMGRIAAHRLRGEIDSADPIAGHAVTPVLVVRASVGPPSA